MKNTFISGMSLLVFKSSYLSCKSHARAPAVSKIRRCRAAGLLPQSTLLTLGKYRVRRDNFHTQTM